MRCLNGLHNGQRLMQARYFIIPSHRPLENGVEVNNKKPG